MKSTGLFGKNSGRVGGVVYSNYRGQQIVKSYQPQVKNPNTAGQIAQRAKFKLVSQAGAVIGDELALAFVPKTSKETPRNAWVKRMLPKAVYSLNEASLPLEEIVLTNETMGYFASDASTNVPLSQSITFTYISPTVSATGGELPKKARVTLIAYNAPGQLVNLGSREFFLPQTGTGANSFSASISLSSSEFYPSANQSGFANYRALVYVYDVNTSSGVDYDEYIATQSTATLDVVKRNFAKALRFSETLNIGLVAGV